MDSEFLKSSKSYTVVIAQAKIEDLRAPKLDLEGKLAKAHGRTRPTPRRHTASRGSSRRPGRRPPSLSSLLHLSRRRPSHSTPRSSASRLPSRSRKGEHELGKCKHQELAKELEAIHQDKLKLEKEIKALKTSAAATTIMKGREVALEAEALEKVAGMWQEMVVAVAIGSAGTAAIVLIYLRLKR
ncbi:unnamed protein product [Urochloa humidicola]